MNHPRVLANCTVEPLGDHRFEVEVTGLPPYNRKHIYEIDAVSEQSAAMQGLRRFEEYSLEAGPAGSEEWL